MLVSIRPPSHRITVSFPRNPLCSERQARPIGHITSGNMRSRPWRAPAKTSGDAQDPYFPQPYPTLRFLPPREFDASATPSATLINLVVGIAAILHFIPRCALINTLTCCDEPLRSSAVGHELESTGRGCVFQDSDARVLAEFTGSSTDVAANSLGSSTAYSLPSCAQAEGG